MGMFQVEVHYLQQICYLSTLTIYCETQEEAYAKAEEVVGSDEFLEEGLDAAGFREIRYVAEGPDIGAITEAGVVLRNAGDE